MVPQYLDKNYPGEVLHGMGTGVACPIGRTGVKLPSRVIAESPTSGRLVAEPLA